MSTATSTKAIAFFGASTGIGLAALKQALLNSHTVVALCRNPDRLTSSLGEDIPTANLTVKKGNAHNVADVAACLVDPRDASGKTLVDSICFSIGGAMNMSTMSLDDPDVCKNGIRALLGALKQLREDGATGNTRPLLVAVSSTGISKHGRDIPLAMIPLYHVMLKQPHADKKVMEDELSKSGERFVLVRPSFLSDGKAGKKVRVAIEDIEKGVEKKEIGYAISREETGQWMYKNLLGSEIAPEYENKAIGVTW